MRPKMPACPTQDTPIFCEEPVIFKGADMQAQSGARNAMEAETHSSPPIFHSWLVSWPFLVAVTSPDVSWRAPNRTALAPCGPYTTGVRPHVPCGFGYRPGAVSELLTPGQSVPLCAT